MATIAERLALLITADVDDAVRGLNKLEREAGSSIGKTEGRLDAVGGSLTRMGAGMMSVGALGIVGLGKAAQATSALNETVSQTEAIFGDASDEIGAFASSAAESIGQSERAARQATAQFGLLLQNMGLSHDETVNWSQDLTVLASDLGSFFDREPEEAVLALGAAIRGESEPIRSFGVMLDDAKVRAKAVELGLAETTAEVDDHGKAQGRLAIIMEDTAAAQGNFALTSDGLANSTRTLNSNMEDFQAKLGEAILPLMESLTGQASGLLESFNKLDPATQSVISKIVTLGTGLLVVGGALSMVVGQAIKMRSNLGTLSKAVTANATAISGAAAVAVVATMVYQRYRNEQERTTTAITNMTTALQNHSSVTEAVGTQVDNAKDNFDGLADAMDTAGITTHELANAIIIGGERLEVMIDRLREAELQNGGTFSSAGLLEDQIRELALAEDEAAKSIEQTNRTMGDAADEAGDLGGAVEEARAEIDVLTASSDLAARSTDDLKQSWSELLDEFLAGFDAQTQADLLLEDIIGAVDDLEGKSLAEIKEQVSGFLREMAGIEAQALESGEDLEGFSDMAAQGMLALLEQAGASEDEIQTVIDALERINGMEAVARIRVDTYAGALDVRLGQLNSAGVSAPPMDLSWLNDPVDRPAGAGGAALFGGGGTLGSTEIRTTVNLNGREIAEAVAEANRESGGQFN